MDNSCIFSTKGRGYGIICIKGGALNAEKVWRSSYGTINTVLHNPPGT